MHGRASRKIPQDDATLHSRGFDVCQALIVMFLGYSRRELSVSCGMTKLGVTCAVPTRLEQVQRTCQVLSTNDEGPEDTAVVADATTVSDFEGTMKRTLAAVEDLDMIHAQAVALLENMLADVQDMVTPNAIGAVVDKRLSSPLKLLEVRASESRY